MFLESLTKNFTAIQCASYEEIEKNQCTFNGVITKLGGAITPNTSKPHGIYYLETEKQSPFVIPDYTSFNKIQIISKSNDTHVMSNDTVEPKVDEHEHKDQTKQEHTCDTDNNQNTLKSQEARDETNQHSENDNDGVKTEQKHHEHGPSEQNKQIDCNEHNDKKNDRFEKDQPNKQNEPNGKNEHNDQENLESTFISNVVSAIQSFLRFVMLHIYLLWSLICSISNKI